MKVKELKEYKSNLYASLSRELADFERNFLLISGAVFSFSITFLDNVVQLQGANVLWTLFISWGCLIVSIFFMMWSFLYSASSSDKLNKNVHCFMERYKLFDDNKDLTNKQVQELRKILDNIFYASKRNLQNMRYVAVVFFMIGLIALSFFVSYNLCTFKS